MMIKIEYPSIGITQTYIGMTADEVDAICDETENGMQRRYGIGWDKGYNVLYDDTSTTMMEMSNKIDYDE